MTEYQSIIDEYSLLGYHMYSTFVPESQWGNKDMANAYLSKYWLPKKEYERVWRAWQKQVFVVNTAGLPGKVFTDDFELLALRGGCLFVEDDFSRLQSCLRALAERTFVIVENAKHDDPLAFRMKFPIDISWTDLMSGNFVSSILFEMPHKEYFVFGSSDGWGKYAANDYENPLDLIGFKPEHRGVFVEHLKTSPEEESEIRDWLPSAYRDQVLRIWT